MTRENREQVPAVKLLAAVLYRHPEKLETCLGLLEKTFAPLDHRSAGYPFSFTDYYEAEMGEGLSRCIVAFEGLIAPLFLVEAKWRAREVEEELAQDQRRTVNVDIGYLDLFKVVLASFKGRGNKLYLDRGVWADMTLTYSKGRFHPLPWSFPDFGAGTYDAELASIRKILKRETAAATPGLRHEGA